MKTLVTGCAGFIGSHLVESLLSDGVEVIGIDCFNENYGRAQKLHNLETARQFDLFEFVPLDLSRGGLVDLVSEVDTVFHLAGEPGVRPSWGSRFEGYVRNNILATQHLLEAAVQVADVRVVYASSSSVYGHAESYPTTEDMLPRPYSPYGVTKLSAEHLMSLYHENLGLETVSLRYFSVYGPRQRPDMAFARFCEAAVSGKEITVFGDGRQVRDFTYVADVVAGTRAAATGRECVGGVYNIGGGGQTSVREALDLLTRLLGRDLKVRYEPAVKGDVRRTAASVERARRDLAFEPATDFADGLAQQLAAVREGLELATA